MLQPRKYHLYREGVETAQAQEGSNAIRVHQKDRGQRLQEVWVCAAFVSSIAALVGTEDQIENTHLS